MSSKLAILIKEIITSEVQEFDSHDQLLKGMTEKIFKALTQTSEASKFVVYLFKAKYERIDFNYFDSKDINKIYKQVGAEKMGMSDRRKSSFKTEYELAKIEDMEYEIIHYNQDKSGYLKSVMTEGRDSSGRQVNDSILTTTVSPTNGQADSSAIEDENDAMFRAIEKIAPKKHSDTLISGVSTDNGARSSSIGTTNSSPGHAGLGLMINHLGDVIEAVLD